MNQKSKKFFLNKQSKSLKGFTLVELLVVIAIITILSAISFSGYHSQEKSLALQRSAQKLAQDIDYAKNLAMNAQEFKGEIPQGGYGIYLTSGAQDYKLYADTNGNKKYNSGDGIVQNISLEKGVYIYKISSPSSLSSLSINFTAPDPIITLSSGSKATITLCIEEADCNNNLNIKKVTVYKTGLIEVEVEK